MLAFLPVVPGITQVPPKPATIPLQFTAVQPSLFDGWVAWRKLKELSGAAHPNAAVDIEAAAHLGLRSWMAGDRSSAIALWTRTRLKMMGAETPENEVLQSLRIEFISDGMPSRFIRGPVSIGGNSAMLAVRVRSQFPVSIDAVRRFEQMDLEVKIADDVRPSIDSDIPLTRRSSMDFDSGGHLRPVRLGVNIGPIGLGETRIELHVLGKLCDWISVENQLGDYVGERAECFKAAFAADELSSNAIHDAQEVFESRVELLNSSPSEESSVQFLLGAQFASLCEGAKHWNMQYETLKADLGVEAAELAAGRSPYRQNGPVARRAIPFWRTFQHGDTAVSAWIRLPVDDSGQLSKVPLLIALHEGGLDEGWCFWFGADCALFTATDWLKAVIVVLDAAALNKEPGQLASVIKSIEHDVKIDRSRIYVLGIGTVPFEASLLDRWGAISFAGKWGFTDSWTGPRPSMLNVERLIEAGLRKLAEDR